LSDNYTDVADVECDDSDYPYHTDRLHGQQADANFMRLALLSSYVMMFSAFV